jgi:NAD(P)-dependent dehydrogenase (short-subunit alcohol dehydrogenase family)
MFGYAGKTEAFRAYRDRTVAAPDPVPVVLPDGVVRRSSNAIPLGRLGTAGDIADLILFLASEGAALITGRDFVVDGGLFGSL